MAENSIILESDTIYLLVKVTQRILVAATVAIISYCFLNANDYWGQQIFKIGGLTPLTSTYSVYKYSRDNNIDKTSKRRLIVYLLLFIIVTVLGFSDVLYLKLRQVELIKDITNEAIINEVEPDENVYTQPAQIHDNGKLALLSNITVSSLCLKDKDCSVGKAIINYVSYTAPLYKVDYTNNEQLYKPELFSLDRSKLAFCNETKTSVNYKIKKCGIPKDLDTAIDIWYNSFNRVSDLYFNVDSETERLIAHRYDRNDNIRGSQGFLLAYRSAKSVRIVHKWATSCLLDKIDGFNKCNNATASMAEYEALQSAFSDYKPEAGTYIIYRKKEVDEIRVASALILPGPVKSNGGFGGLFFLFGGVRYAIYSTVKGYTEETFVKVISAPLLDYHLPTNIALTELQLAATVWNQARYIGPGKYYSVVSKTHLKSVYIMSAAEIGVIISILVLSIIILIWEYINLSPVYKITTLELLSATQGSDGIRCNGTKGYSAEVKVVYDPDVKHISVSTELQPSLSVVPVLKRNLTDYDSYKGVGGSIDELQDKLALSEENNIDMHFNTRLRNGL